MIENPRLKYSYHAEFLDDDKVLLLSENDSSMVSGLLYSKILFEIQHTGLPVDELAAKLEEDVSPFQVYFAIDQLEKKGYITEDAPAFPPETCAYWDSLGIEVHRLARVLQEKTISLETLGPLSADIFTQTFNAMGIQTSGTASLKVVITDDYERSEFQQINSEALVSNQAWMPIKPSGTELWIGPIFEPGETACWECLNQRLGINRPISTFYKLQKNTKDNPQMTASAIPQSIQIAANQAAIEIIKWLYFGKNEELNSKIAAFNTASFHAESHVLLKRPQCKACGDPGYNNSELRPLILEKRSSGCVTSHGGYREVSSEDTVEKYRHHVSPVTGVVQTLKPYHSKKDTPIYNYTSGHNTALKSKTIFWLNQHLRSSNGGKGKTWSQAKAGALCESIERYSLMYHDQEPSFQGSLLELPGHGIHPNACMNYSEEQYKNRESINQTSAKFYSLVPIPFDESLKMDWTSVYSLSEEKFKYLPSCFCYAQYPAEDEWHLFSYPDSNGCAAGNTREEAILQGFLEMVERDCVALWWYNMVRKPGVDLHSFNEPYFLTVMEYYKSLNRSIYVLDLTSDLQIPTFGAFSHRLDNGSQDIVFGFGSHVDAKIALERAIVELNQLLPIANVPEADRAQGKYLTQDKVFVDWLSSATRENQPYLLPLENVPEKKASDYAPLCAPNIYDSVTHCIEAAAKQDLETLVLDLTQPDVGLPVVKVIVPGLRHFWQRLAPGRLYDVPVKMGWLERPRKEEELNPIGLFI
ncbi:MAG: TOMM precursor leader peptide-binding protein [bacterium]|nr:TOMM precursor leader peptide-binding protein [bacterium]